MYVITQNFRVAKKKKKTKNIWKDRVLHGVIEHGHCQ